MAKKRGRKTGCLWLVVGGLGLAVAAAGNMGRVPSAPSGATAAPVLNATRIISTAVLSPDDRLATAWSDVPGVERVELARVIDNAVYGEINVERDAQGVATAEALANAARQTLMSASLEIAVILDNGVSASDYRWSNVTDSWSITPLTMVTRQPTQGATLISTPTLRVMGFAAPRTMCNGVDDLNCSDFASGAAAAAHIAACGDEDQLDRDGDGRACEGR